MSGTKKNKLTKNRVYAYVSEETKQWLINFQENTGKRSIGEAIEELVLRSKESNQNQLLGDVLADAITAQVVDQLKEPLDILRRRTGYSDRQTKVITEMLNHMVTALQIDKMPSEVATTDVSKTGALTAAEGRITDQLNHFAQQSATKKAERAAQKIDHGKTE